MVSYPLPVGGDCSVSNMVEDALVSEVKSQWKRLWQERIDDSVRAEGVASMDFDKLWCARLRGCMCFLNCVRGFWAGNNVLIVCGACVLF